MSMLILPTLLVIHNILVYLKIEDMLGFLDVFDGYLEYLPMFRHKKYIRKVINYIFAPYSINAFAQRKKARKFIKTFPKVFDYFINYRYFASMITQKTKTFDFAGKFMNDENFIKENLTSDDLYKSIPEELKNEGITEYFLKKCGYSNFGIIPKKFKILKKIFLPALEDDGLIGMNYIPDNKYFHNRKFIIELLNNLAYGDIHKEKNALLKDKLSDFSDDEEIVKRLVINRRQYQELNFASKRLYDLFISEIPIQNFYEGRPLSDDLCFQMPDSDFYYPYSYPYSY